MRSPHGRWIAALALGGLALAGPATAKDPERALAPQQATQTGEDAGGVCGRELMSADELREHHAKMRGLATPEERQAYRAQHHAEMARRAAERGVTLDPASCPGGGKGMGMRGQGMGPGPGPGVAPPGTPEGATPSPTPPPRLPESQTAPVPSPPPQP